MKIIELTKGNVALVDDEDYDRLMLYSWCAHKSRTKKTFDAKRQSFGKTYYMHREIMGLAFGDPREVDHKDFNGLNNQKYNLRIVTATENKKYVPSRNHSSRFRGVTWDSERGKWRAQTQINGKMKNVGRFDSEEEAAAARDLYVSCHDDSGFIVLNSEAHL